jgi:catechol 2,3-dioxygenase-like lactoylglutathione lyase family enzyme
MGKLMSQSIGQVAIVVRDYDEALRFYVGVMESA